MDQPCSEVMRFSDGHEYQCEFKAGHAAPHSWPHLASILVKDCAVCYQEWLHPVTGNERVDRQIHQPKDIEVL